MRSFLAALVSSFLLSSTLVHSHIIDNSVFSPPESRSVSIYVKIKSAIKEPENRSKCEEEDDSCSDKDTSDDAKFWTGSPCQAGNSTCSDALTYRYGFRCEEEFFTQGMVMDAAKAACPYISSNSQRYIFPAAYTKSKFSKLGPYVEWPIKRNGWIWNMFSRSRYRIIMTYDCTVVGAVTRLEHGERYTPCGVEPH
ncbi:hypothetical protein Golomagni_04014 [Golovinomyces magnicellulatus]|nr:hypothetical protein Golomagni_04014 [Golovinomyces magnicellulatus]